MGAITDKFESYLKWGATKFSDLFGFDVLNSDGTDGLKWLLQEDRSKTSVAISELEDGINANDAKISTIQEKIEDFKFMLGGNNIIRYDDTGVGSVMVRIPRMKRSDIYENIVAGSAEDGWCSTFIRQDGSIRDYIEISKYQNIVENSRAYSVPGVDPKVYTTWDQAKSYCENKGDGWILMTREIYALLAAWSEKNGTVPHGNNYAGRDIDHPHETGVLSYIWKLSYDWNNRAYSEEPEGTFWHTGRCLTGSGATTWSHNHKEDGVYDLNGNIWEWGNDFKIVNKVAYVAPYCGAPENEWVSTGVDICTGRISGQAIATLMTGDIPNVDNRRWEELGIPATTGAANYNGDAYWFNASDERFMLHGGYWADGSSAGVRASHLNDARSISYSTVGFRAAFIGNL